MLTRKIGPALAAGCTIVLKPAEQTPLLAVEVFKIFEEIGLPAGVVNLVTTRRARAVGAELVTNPLVRKITFTGSTEVGKLLDGAGRAEREAGVAWSWAATRRSSCSTTPIPGTAAEGAAR